MKALRINKIIIGVITISTLFLTSSCSKSTNPSYFENDEKSLELLQNLDREALDYFFEVALNSEFGDSSSQIRKWTQAIEIYISGSYTDTDENTVKNIIDELKTITDESLQIKIGSKETANLTIIFCDPSEFNTHNDYVPENVNGFVTVWKNQNSEIQKSQILISSSSSDSLRPHIIREELTQSLGLLNDSWEYENSIFYQGYSKTDQYSDIDKLVIQILYLSSIEPGMNITDIFNLNEYYSKL